MGEPQQKPVPEKCRIAAIHLPRFLIQRRLREDASLAHRPVAVVKSQENTDLVVAASQSALFAGVRVGGTVTQAKALCPGLILRPDDPAGDVRALEAVAEALLAASPQVELDGPEGLFVDTSAAALFGGEPGLYRVLVDRLKVLGYRGSVVIADNKFTALALATHRPHLKSRVIHGPVKEALAPLPLSALPTTESLLWALSAMGVRSLGEFAALPPPGVAARFGTEGALMQRLAQGDDPRPLVPFRPAPPLIERYALEWPADSLEPVSFALKTVLDRLTARLSGRGLALAKLEVLLTLEPRGESRVLLPLARATNSSKMLLNVFRERLRDVKVEAPVTALAVEALETAPAARVQLCVGDRPELDEALEAVLARLRAGLGEGALFAARPVDAHRPEGSYEQKGFTPGAEEKASVPAKQKKPKKAFLAKLLDDGDEQERPLSGKVPLEDDPLGLPGMRPTRLLEQPKPIEVELSPAGRLLAVRIGQRRHVAASVRGPERLQGEWWKQGFTRDYYRALVAGVGGCWLYRDGKDGRFYLHGYFD